MTMDEFKAIRPRQRAMVSLILQKRSGLEPSAWHVMTQELLATVTDDDRREAGIE